MADSLKSIEHRVFKPLKSLGPRRVLLAVSGGVDSMAMAHLLFQWRSALQWEIAVAHVHHGLGADVKQNEFRNAAAHLVEKWARTRELTVFTNAPTSQDLRSEGALRDFRLGWLERWAVEGEFDSVAFAHHRDDLLETRLLRLLRGSGPQGVKAMSRTSFRRLRPLLGLSREEVLDYARRLQIGWLEDPSNMQTSSLRNWLRNSWLPALEKRQTGAKKALARSLSLVSEEVNVTLGPYVGLRRKALTALSSSRQQTLVAGYFRTLGVANYEQTHVEELMKRLKTERKNFEFEMLKMRFQVSPDFLWASRVCEQDGIMLS